MLHHQQSMHFGPGGGGMGMSFGGAGGSHSVRKLAQLRHQMQEFLVSTILCITILIKVIEFLIVQTCTMIRATMFEL